MLSGFEPDGLNQAVEIIGDFLIETIELRSLVRFEADVCGNRTEQAGGQWGVDALEQFEEDEANGVAARWELISARSR